MTALNPQAPQPRPGGEAPQSRRLHDELRRLYGAASVSRGAAAATEPDIALADSQGRVRALVLELARPADWTRLGEVWRGVQQDMELPAPAIAITGSDGVALWFSLVEPVPAAIGHAFLEALCCRWLGDVKMGRLGLWPQPGDGGAGQATATVPALPGEQVTAERWSAFVAADLAAMFAEEPWVDMPPSPTGQAELLTRLRSIPPEALADALEQLAPTPAAPGTAAPATTAPAAGTPATAGTATTGTPPAMATPAPAPRGAADEACRFLLQVMNDDAVDLALRIEAAKALLGAGP